MDIIENIAEAPKRSAVQGRKSAKKRDAIIAVATEIINRRTYALATMSEIAAALDLRDAALYYYFPSKEDLLYACNLKSMARYEGFLRDADQEADTGAAKLERFLRLFIEGSVRDGPLLYFGDYYHLQGKKRAAIANNAQRLTAMLEQFLIAGGEDGSLKQCDTAVVVHLLLGMLIWLAKWTDYVEGMTGERLLSAIIALNLEGLGDTRP